MTLDLPNLGEAVFWVALLQIIGVNIVLSGDNAVVIALACRSLPPRQQKLGIVLGAGAAVLLRMIFTGFVVFLMATPFLKILGGLLLFWIAYKLITEEEKDDDHVKAAGHLWAAIWTIMIADAVMSLDNVIAVAAAAKGSLFLILLGLGISIPLVVYGATILIRLINRFPVIVTLGAALIGYVAGEVIVTDPAVHHWVELHANWLHVVAPLLGAILVVDAGRLLKPKQAQIAHSAREAVVAPTAIAGFRLVPIFLGRMILYEAPLIVSFAAGLLGYTVADQTLFADGARWAEGWRALAQSVGPLIGAAIALVLAELLGRMFRKRPAAG
jgi:YjbE family integral membrane protein